ncbi:ribonuclease P protein subunit p14-like [Rhynchophorus ferrugineus]|uniref:ribonuclease P protein subunit p14-like n=1 Tax=Rhynchophorus ferrugineus TaxID=354439 RepID=UPI003FCDD566
MSKYYYLDVSMVFEFQKEVTPAYFKKYILESIKQIFGEFAAAAIQIDILKFNPETLRAVLRVPKEFYIKLRASLTLSGQFEGVKCSYIVHKASPLLLALQGDSRDYQH